MAICIAEETATGSRDPAAIGDRFLDWFHGDQQDVGIQTRRVLVQASNGSELTAIAAGDYERHPRGAAGNGSLMHTAPVALAHLGDDAAIADFAMKVSALTHGDPLAGEACVLWCIAIDRAVREGRLDRVKDGLNSLPARKRDFWDATLTEAETNSPKTFRPNGFIVPALQAAYASVMQTPTPRSQPCRHLQDALRTAISIGGDTDTVAAIAGALLGARWGSSAVPLEWRHVMHGWPGYRTRDLVRLAILSSHEGKNAVQTWPRAERMLSDYENKWRPEGIAKPLPSDEGVLIGDVKGLRGRGGDADVVVSLCRMGTLDVTAPERHEIWLIDENDPCANPNLDFILEDTAGFIAARRAVGQTVFLHCVRAESRTPVVAAAYLRLKGSSPEEALAEVHGLLPDSRINGTFKRAIRGTA